jgi:hypothetical protein
MKMNVSPDEAGQRFDAEMGLAFEDGNLGLKYVLLRLELAGLTAQDQKNLRDLISAACRDQDVTESADRVRNAESASPLAAAIANIVQNAKSQKKAAALGALFGAHGAMVPFGSKRDPIECAIAGAGAASSIALLNDGTLSGSLNDFLVRDV